MRRYVLTLTTILVSIVIALHLGFMVLEMAFWDHDIGRRIFSLTPEFSKASKVFAANQGIYNGLLAAGIYFIQALPAALAFAAVFAIGKTQ